MPPFVTNSWDHKGFKSLIRWFKFDDNRPLHKINFQSRSILHSEKEVNFMAANKGPGQKLGRLGNLRLLEPTNGPSFPSPSFPVCPMFKLESSDFSDEVVRLFLCQNYRISPMLWKKTRTCRNSKTRTSPTKWPKFPLCPNFRISA